MLHKKIVFSFLFSFFFVQGAVQLCSLTWWNADCSDLRLEREEGCRGRETTWLIEKTRAGQRKQTVSLLPVRGEKELSTEHTDENQELVQWLFTWNISDSAGHSPIKLVTDVHRHQRIILTLHTLQWGPPGLSCSSTHGTHFKSNSNEQIAIDFTEDIHVPQRINLLYYGFSMSFPLQNVNFTNKIPHNIKGKVPWNLLKTVMLPKGICNPMTSPLTPPSNKLFLACSWIRPNILFRCLQEAISRAFTELYILASCFLCHNILYETHAHKLSWSQNSSRHWRNHSTAGGKLWRQTTHCFFC